MKDRAAPASIARTRFPLMLGLAACAGAGWLGGRIWSAQRGAVQEHAVRGWTGIPFAGSGIVVPATAGTATSGTQPVLRIFGDYECSGCRSLEATIGDSLRALAARGRLRLIYYQAPLRAHRRAPIAGALTYCAEAQGRGIAVQHALYASIGAWSHDAPLPAMLRAAAGADADTRRLQTCMASGSGEAAVRRDRALAERIDTRAVPLILLDSMRLEVSSWRALLRHVRRRLLPDDVHEGV